MPHRSSLPHLIKVMISRQGPSKRITLSTRTLTIFVEHALIIKVPQGTSSHQLQTILNILSRWIPLLPSSSKSVNQLNHPRRLSSMSTLRIEEDSVLLLITLSHKASWQIGMVDDKAKMLGRWGTLRNHDLRAKASPGNTQLTFYQL